MKRFIGVENKFCTELNNCNVAYRTSKDNILFEIAEDIKF